MRVFLSWSGERSHGAAAAFYQWLPDVLQFVDPWMSSEDIQSGASWNSEIRSALDSCEYGVLFITRDNWQAPWLLFEAGALAKHTDESRVVPLIVDDELSPADLKGPLIELQARQFNNESVSKLVEELNAMWTSPLDSIRLSRLFQRSWPEIESAYSYLPGISTELIARSQDDKIDEILGMVRGLTIGQRRRNPMIPSALYFRILQLVQPAHKAEVMRLLDTGFKLALLSKKEPPASLEVLSEELRELFIDEGESAEGLDEPLGDDGSPIDFTADVESDRGEEGEWTP